MTSTFSDFVASKPDKDLMKKQVQDYCKMLCEALIENYKSYSIRSHNHSIVRALDEGDSTKVQYHEDRIQEIKNNVDIYDFYMVEGRKYWKIVMSTDGDYRCQSVHAFVDKSNGDVYKSASFKTPAKGVRYNLLDESSRENVLANCDWSGSYLYQR
jgi:hypothetical protein